MAVTAEPPVTVDDFRLIPESNRRIELIDGRLVMSPSPGHFHQQIVMNVAIMVGNHVRSNSLGAFLASPFDTYLDDTNAFQPDLLFVRRNRLHFIEEDGLKAAPDWAAEVLSPSTAHLDLGPKRKSYAQHGMEEYWIVDPGKETVAVYRLQSDPEIPVTHREATFESAMFPGLECRTSEIFER